MDDCLDLEAPEQIVLVLVMPDAALIWELC